MRLKQILKNKRGVAIENAILFMIVVFFLCTLITSVTLIGHYQVKIENLSLIQDVNVEQVGEDFIAGENLDQKYNKEIGKSYYADVEVENNIHILRVWHKNDTDKKVLLYVEAELTVIDGIEELKVRTWRYSDPNKTE